MTDEQREALSEGDSLVHEKHHFIGELQRARKQVHFCELALKRIEKSTQENDLKLEQLGVGGNHGNQK